MKRLIIIMILSLLIGCKSSNSLGDGFMLDYVDIPSDRNIFYKDQGIFNDLTLDMVVFNKDKILVRAYMINLDNTTDTSKYVYYIIDKQRYIDAPNQMSSIGLNGPLSLIEFNIEKDRLLNAEVLNWK